MNYLIPVVSFNESILCKGSGSYVFDTNGKRYLDLNSGQFCTVLGHSNTGLAKRIANLAENLVHTSSGMLSENVLNAAALVHDISGEMRAYSIFLSTGAEAVEFSIRYAKHLTGKNGIICFFNGYHGLTLGAQSVTFGGKYAKPQITDVYSVHMPDTFPKEHDIDRCIEEFASVANKNKDKLAAAVFEPIVSVGGMIFPHKRYLSAVKEICNANNILLIFDECQTGFARTGTWFFYQQIDIIPDIVACAKGIGLGFPVSLVMFSEKLIQANQISMMHYSSHQNDPFAAEIVKFGIEYIRKYGLLEIIKSKGDFFLHKLVGLCEQHKNYARPRGNGLMLGVDLEIENIKDYRRIYRVLTKEAAEKGVLIQGTAGGRVLRFLPDYLIKKVDIEFCIDVLSSINFADKQYKL